MMKIRIKIHIYVYLLEFLYLILLKSLKPSLRLFFKKIYDYIKHNYWL